MTIIIRLQGLPWAASALDIRHYFKGLTIPDGGVHIVGGESGDAFIAFGTDEDARKAMMLTNKPLCGSKVTLMLSSKNEMQSVIAASRAVQARKRGDPFQGALEPATNERGAPPIREERSLDRSKSFPGELEPAPGHTGYPSAVTGRRSSDVAIPSFDFGRPDAGPYGRQDEPSFMHRSHDMSLDRPGLDRPSHDRSSHGQDRLPHGQDRLPHGQDRLPHGQDRLPHGQDRLPHGQDRLPHGQDRLPHGQDRLPHGQDRLSQGQDRLPHGQDRLPHGQDRLSQGQDRMPHGQDRLPYNKQNPMWIDEKPGFPFDKRDTLNDPSPSHGRPGPDEPNFMGRFGEHPPRDAVPPRRGSYYSDRQDRQHEHQIGREPDPPLGSTGEQSFRNGRFERSFEDEPYRRFEEVPNTGRPDEAPLRNNRFEDRPDMDSYNSGSSERDRRRSSQEGRYSDSSNFNQGRGEGQYRSSSSRYNEDRPSRHEGRSRFEQSGSRSDQPFDDGRRGRPSDRRPDQPSREPRSGGSGMGALLIGLPYSASEEDIVKFFSGIMIERDGIHIGADRTGKRTGEAFVKFSSRRDHEEALKRNKEYIGPRYINVQPYHERDWIIRIEEGAPKFRRNPDSFHGPMGGGRDLRRGRSRSPLKDTLCVSLRGVPYHADKQLVMEFFHGINVTEDNIFLETNERGQASGMACVEFQSLRDFRNALDKHKQYMGSRYISVIPIGRDEMQSRVKAHMKRTQEDMTAPPGAKLSGGMNSPPSNSDNNKAGIGEKEREREREREPKHISERGTESRPPVDGNAELCVHLKNVPYLANNQDILQFFTGIPLPQQSIHRIYNDKGQTTGEAFVEFYTIEHAKLAVERNNQRIKDRPVYIDRVSKADMDKRLKENEPCLKLAVEKRTTMGGTGATVMTGNLGQPPLLATPPLFNPLLVGGMQRHDWPRRPDVMGPGGLQREGGYVNRDNEPSGENVGGSSSCVVGATNLPFSATIPEIMDFFHGYGALPDTFRIHLNDAGQPTGDALVAFETPQQAVRALRELHNKPMGPRRVQLYLA